MKLLIAGAGELTEALKKRASDLAVPTAFTGFVNQFRTLESLRPCRCLRVAFDKPRDLGAGDQRSDAVWVAGDCERSGRLRAGPRQAGRNGLCFFRRPTDLAQAMERLITHGRTRMREMGQLARQHVLVNYSMANATTGLLAALDAVAVDGARS